MGPPITGTTIRRPRPSASTLEFTSPSQKTHESTSTQISQSTEVVLELIHPTEQLDQENDQENDQEKGQEHDEKLSEVSSFYESENIIDQVSQGPEGLQMASNSFLIEVKFIFNF